VLAMIADVEQVRPRPGVRRDGAREDFVDPERHDTHLRAVDPQKSFEVIDRAIVVGDDAARPRAGGLYDRRVVRADLCFEVLRKSEMDQVVNRDDEPGRHNEGHVLRRKVHHIESRAAHRHRQRNLFRPTEVPAGGKHLVGVLGRDSRQTRDELAHVRLHSGGELPRRSRVEADARRAHGKSAFLAATAG